MRRMDWWRTFACLASSARVIEPPRTSIPSTAAWFSGSWSSARKYRTKRPTEALKLSASSRLALFVIEQA